MHRQGVTEKTFNPAHHPAPLPSHAYQLLDNKDFGLSYTYPRELIVPLGLTLGEVVACSRFRTKERLPILTFLYEYRPGRFSSLFRCSQIKSGLFSARCE
jgi:myotubularin-related protein 6/7/8